MKKQYLLMSLGILTLSTFCLNGCATSTIPETIKVETINNQNGITVSAKEKVKVVPDKAEIEFSVYSQANTPTECEKQNTQKINEVISYLKESGIDEKNIQTSDYGLNPDYKWKDDERILTGYSIETVLTLTNLDIDKVGNILTESINKGINNVNNIQYYSSKYDECYQEALTLAINSAKQKADIIATSSNSNIIKVKNITEGYYNDSVKYTNYQANGKMMVTENDMAMESAIDIQPGELDIEAEVTITYEIN